MDFKKFSTNTPMYIVLLLLLVIVLFNSFIFSNQMLVSSDQMNGLGDKVFTKVSLTKHFQFPMWLSCRLGGMPTIDAVYGDTMYFPSLLIHMLLPPHRAIGMKMIIHIFLAGVFFYLLLRKGFKAPRFAAFIGGAFYMLNPQFVSHIYSGHDGKMYIIAWLPFMVWRLKILMENPNLFNASLLSLGLALCVFTSHPQMIYFVLWGFFFYWLFYCIIQYRQSKKIKLILPHISYFWLSIFVGLGIGIIQLYPSIMYIRDELSVRGIDRGYEFAKSWSLHWPEIISLWVPEFGNTLQYYWSENPFKLNYEYTGAIALLFSIVAVVYKPSPWRFFWVGVALFAILFSLGGHTPLFPMVYHIVPGVKKFRACSMIMLWFSFSIVLLSSLFCIDVLKDDFVSMAEERVKKWKKGLLISIGAISTASLLFAIKPFALGIIKPLCITLEDPKKMQIFDVNFSKNFLPYLTLWWILAVTTLLMLWAVLQKKMNKSMFLIIIFIFGIIDTFRINAQFIKTQNHRPFFFTEPIINDLQEEMAKEPFRCFILPGTFNVQNNIAGIYKLEGVSGFHDNELKWYAEFRGRNKRMMHYFKDLIQSDKNGNPYLVPENIQKGNNFLNIANVKYILTRNHKRELVALKNMNYSKRISFVPSYTVIKDTEIIDELMNTTHNFKTNLSLDKEPEEKFNTSPSLSADDIHFTVNWDTYSPNYRKAHIKTDHDGLLRISEVYYPGWKIKIDNKPVKIYKADMAWMATSITKGEHIIELFIDSNYLKQCAPVSIILIFSILGYWVFYFSKKSRNKLVS